MTTQGPQMSVEQKVIRLEGTVESLKAAVSEIKTDVHGILSKLDQVSERRKLDPRLLLTLFSVLLVVVGMGASVVMLAVNARVSPLEEGTTAQEAVVLRHAQQGIDGRPHPWGLEVRMLERELDLREDLQERELRLREDMRDELGEALRELRGAGQ